MRLILIRHGRPNEDDADAPHDPPLNAHGRRQAQAAARLLETEGLTRIVASPLRRARQTAESLAERLGLSIETIDDWAEADRGSIRYRSTETLRAEGGDAWSRFLADPIGYLGGDPASFRAGVLGALAATVANESATARVAVFTHGMPINIVLSHALGLESITRFLVGYGSVTRLRHLGDGRYGVVSVNETGHHKWTP
ncbi:histidine phosphatase family protein [Roseiarcus sp.]|uniref:histidine phosphatase family protein n=1 Tax=Roseiarcus sp. TaxID=1969460 RepID=UPI003F9E781E